MINLFKNIFFLPLIVVAALGLAPSYAAKTVTYYTFVTYNINGKWELAKHVKPHKLSAGSYRFQIVRFSQTDDTPHALVIALRGEFQFVADPKGGVKINKKYALDEPQQVDSRSNDNNDNFSVWRDDVEKSWEKARKQWVEPLVTQMKKSVPGGPEPNFIRFLLGKESIQEWKGEDKNTYRLYRLHYNTKAYRFFDNENDRKTFSLFINPTHKVVTDIVQLQEWVDSQKGFTLAKYMGTADDKHKAFYGNFKTWFNQLSSDAKRIEEITGEIQTLQEMVRQKTQEANQHANDAQDAVITANKNAGISTEEIDRKKEAAKVAKKAKKEAKKQAKRFKKSVAAVKKALKANNIKKANDEMEKANEAAKNAENAAKNAENAAKEAITTQKNSFGAIFLVLLILLAVVITAWFLAKKLRNRHYYNHEDDHEDDFVYEFFDNNKENKLASKKSKPELSKNKPSTTISNEELYQLNKRLLALERNVDNIGNQALSQDELSNIVINKILNDKFSEIASQLFQHSEMKDAMKSQIKTYLDGNFKKELNKSIELYAARYWKEFIEKKGDDKTIAHPSTKLSESLKTESSKRTTQALGKSQLPDVATNDVADKIKILLSGINSIDKVALNTLEVTVEPCLFVVNVILNDIILNFSITDYQRIDKKIQALTDGFVKLIIPTIGADILHTEHKIVHQQSITKGKLNAVVALIRPGVKCDNIVKRKAEIIQSI